MNHFILKIISMNYCLLFEINIKNKENKMYRIHSFLHIFIYLFIASFYYSPIYHLEFSKIRLQLKRRKFFLLYFILQPLSLVPK